MPHTVCATAAAVASSVALLSLVLPAVAAADDPGDRMQSNTQLRGFLQGCVMYAVDNGNWFPQMSNQGVVQDPGTNAGVYAILLEQDYIPGTWAISPRETLEPWAGAWDADAPVTSGHLSYATLKLDPVGTAADTLTPRNQTWRSDANPQAIAASDRNTGTADHPASVWTTDRQPGWRGSVCWMDGHTTFEQPADAPREDVMLDRGDVVTTELVNDKPVEADRLFAVDLAANADVLMTFDVFNGQEVRVPRRGR